MLRNIKEAMMAGIVYNASVINESYDLMIKIHIKILGLYPINDFEAYYLEDGEIVRRFRHDIYPPMRMGI